MPSSEILPCLQSCNTEQSDPQHESDTDSSVDVLEKHDRLWNVLIWNDPVNLMAYVVYVIQTLFGYSLEKATRHMMQVHNDGRSVVASTEREKAEIFVGKLHTFGLQATLEKA